MDTYVNHAHVTVGTVVLVVGVLGLVFSLIRKLILIAVLAVVLLVAGAVTAGIALHGTHCSSTSTSHTCLPRRY